MEIFKQIEDDYGVEITGGISDKQSNIVNAFQGFRPGIPHAYCQFHFLDHVSGPIVAKDSHLLAQLRSDVRGLSLVKGHAADHVNPVGNKSPVGDVLAPLIEELKCAISTTGDCIKIFPGIEAYTNLEYVLSCISPLVSIDMPARVKRSLTSLVGAIGNILDNRISVRPDTEQEAIRSNHILRLWDRHRQGQEFSHQHHDPIPIARTPRERGTIGNLPRWFASKHSPTRGRSGSGLDGSHAFQGVVVHNTTINQNQESKNVGRMRLIQVSSFCHLHTIYRSENRETNPEQQDHRRLW